MTRLDPPQREVDYSINPTDLFNLINCRHWNAALLRCHQSPEEASTWITRKGSGRDAGWRFLPIHLVCMESQLPEDLAVALLSAYPHGATMLDDKGMLPLHYACGNGASERMINALFQAHPLSLSVQGGCNRTPMEIATSSSNPNRDRTVAAIKSLMSKFGGDDNGLLKVHPPVAVAVQDPVDHALVGSQLKIMKLEDDLAVAEAVTAEIQRKLQDAADRESYLLDQIRDLEAHIADESIKRARLAEKVDHLTKSNHDRSEKLDESAETFVSLQGDIAKERADMQGIVAALKSEASTARAMSDALEAKLQSKFASENLLSSRVEELEGTLRDNGAASTAAAASFKARETALTTENDALRDSVSRLTESNSSLQSKVNGLTEAVVALVESLNTMSSEQEQMVLDAEKYETVIRESAASERRELLESIDRQRRYFEAATAEQERMLEKASKREEKTCADSAKERQRVMDSIASQKKLFHTFSEVKHEQIQQLVVRTEDVHNQTSEPPRSITPGL